jgi:hypothetical protein
MTCKEFETYATELARERELEPGARREAMAHAETCAACARRLRDERDVTAALAAFGAASKGAPERLETSVLAAFRAHHAGSESAPTAPIAPIAAPQTVVPFPRRVSTRVWRVAAAACAAVVVGIAGWAVVSKPGAQPGPAAPASEVAASAPRPVDPRLTDSTQRPFETNEIEEHGPPIRQVANHEPSRMHKPRRATSAPREPRYREVELTTDFYPLVAGAGAGPVEGGQIVRVEVPRASLAAMGFEMNPARADESITADVVLAHDGTARAIRLVQPALMLDRSTTR